MRKHITQKGSHKPASPGAGSWLDLERLARVELSSEDPDYPIEGALVTEGGSGWRADHPGRQTIRLVFDQPQKIRRIVLIFEEAERARTQEFALRWSAGDGAPYRDILRQQYHFSPPGTSRELEDYTVNLSGVLMLELDINPDMDDGDARAALAQMRLA